MNDRKVQYSIRHNIYYVKEKKISNVTSHEKDVIQDN